MAIAQRNMLIKFDCILSFQRDGCRHNFASVKKSCNKSTVEAIHMCIRWNRATRNEWRLQIDVLNEFVYILPLAKVSLPFICKIALNHLLEEEEFSPLDIFGKNGPVFVQSWSCTTILFVRVVTLAWLCF